MTSNGKLHGKMIKKMETLPLPSEKRKRQKRETYMVLSSLFATTIIMLKDLKYI